MISEQLIQHLASKDLYVFPVQSNKKPYRKTRGWNDATNDPVEAIEMFKSRPDALIAIATEPSHLIIFDVDNHPDELDDDGNPKDGLKSYAELRAEHGEFPPTWVVNTPSGGLHYYFTATQCFKRAISELALGIDLLSKGSYVVAPSETNTCNYQFAPGCSWYDMDQPAPCPQWILDWLEENKSVQRQPKTSQNPTGVGLSADEADIIPEGTRNDTLYREACSLRAKGLGYNQIVGALAVTNERQCQPPLEDAEVLRLVESACQHEPGTSRSKQAGRPKKDVAELATQIQEHGLESFTDTGNARRLVSLHGENLRYTSQFGWLVWDETRWIIDDTGQMERFCKDTAERIQDEALLVEPEEEKELYGDILRHANNSLNQSRLDAMKKNVSTEAEIRIRHNVLDANPWLFNVLNGTLDLQDGTLRPHYRADHITKLASVLYDPDATCPNWFEFLDQIFQGDWDLIGYVQQVFGYALTGDISWQCLFLLHGSGQNGKSVLLDVLRLLVGDYGAQTDFNTFMVKRNNDTTRNDLAQLVNRRVVCGSEGDIGQHISEALIKQVTGEKRVNACFKYKEPFEYDVTFKVFLATNHLPNITGQDKGIWRRLRVIPFRYEVPDGQRDPRLIEDKFVPERSGILNWALEGCRQWLEGGEQMPRAVVEATGQYREDMDPFGLFLKDCFDLDDATAETATETILEMLKTWSLDNHPPLAQTTGKGLAVKMAEKGIEKSSNKTKRGYRGLRPKYLAERKYTKEPTGLNVRELMASLN